MSTEAASGQRALSRFEQLRFGREVLREEGETLVALAGRLHGEFCDAVDLLIGCTGSVIVTGMGKAGLIGQKITATLASTGTNAHFLHPSEAIHGDLGRVKSGDVVLALSFSGETEEVTRLLPSLISFGVPIIAITGRSKNSLASAAQVVLNIGPLQEVCSLGLAPSTSTTAMLAMGDALALVVSQMRGFAPEDFARFHPGGSLGRKLAKVEEVMRPLDECRVSDETRTVREVFISASRPGRRTGAIMLVDPAGTLTGVFTDSDLARLLEDKRDDLLDTPISDLMTRGPTTVAIGTLMQQAVELLKERKISELPVINELAKPVGLIDITDVLTAESSAKPLALPVDSTNSANAGFPKTLPLSNHLPG